MTRPAWKIEELIVAYTKSARTAKTITKRKQDLKYVATLKSELALQKAKEAETPKEAWLQLLKDARSFGPLW